MAMNVIVIQRLKVTAGKREKIVGKSNKTDNRGHICT